MMGSLDGASPEPLLKGDFQGLREGLRTIG
jgi:hypothetical protein